MSTGWKKGRGRMGPLAPLIGSWKARVDGPMGPVTCARDYQKFGELYVRLDAEWWVSGKGAAVKAYREVCMFGPGDDGVLAFWSYTSDGKKSAGRLSAAAEIHPQSICFEAQMDAGLARQVFWPADSGGFHWVVESRTKKGWSRLADHHYRPA